MISFVRKHYGGELSTPKHFLCLSLEIHQKCGNNISVASIKRILGYVKYNNHPSERTLNLLANYLGFQNFGDFCERTREMAEDSVYLGERKVNIGDVIHLKMSDTLTDLKFRYKGANHFVLIRQLGTPKII